MAKEHIRLIFLGNWPIRRRLTLGFLLAALIAGAAAGAAGLTHAQVLGSEAQLYQQILAANQSLSLADYNLLLMDPALHNALTYAQTNDITDLTTARQSLQTLETQLTVALQRYRTDDLFQGQAQAEQVLSAAGENDLLIEQEQLFASAQRTWSFYQQAQDQVLALIAEGHISQAADLEHRQAEPTHSDAISALNSLVQFDQQLAGAVQSGISQEDQQGTLLSVLAAVLAVCAVLGVGWLISRSFSLPLHYLHQFTQTVSQGRFDSRARPMTSDEIGSVTQAVNGMLDIIVGLLYETRHQRDTLTNRAEQLAGNLRGASAGDLRLQAEESSDVMGRLANAFNLTLNRFRRFISGSQAVILQMESFRRQIVEHSGALSRQARLGAARFAHLDTVAEDLAEQMRQAQMGATEALVFWQNAVEALRRGEAVATRTIEEAQGAELLGASPHTTAAALLQRKQNLEGAVSLAEDVARRAVRVALAAEVQAGQIMERTQGLRMVTEELRSLSEHATEAAYQLSEAIADVQRAVQDAAAEINANSQMRAEIMRRSIGATSEIRQTFQLLEEALGGQGHRLNQVRVTISHAQAAEEISRATKESSSFLYSTASEANLIAQAAEQLGQFEQRLLASLAPFKLPEPSGSGPSAGNPSRDERFIAAVARKTSWQN
ncbi:MAG TPA: methyl-accepting chemotaxis protein [Ktedonobacterales bacterium]|nr:methyl-accepting chemotaxis protein [Ktedonobacterales bacterium]